MPRKGTQMGFEELSPNMTASRLFGHVHPQKDQVAVISKYTNNASYAYLEAFERRGIHSRLVSGTTGTQDFCFLAKTNQQIAGSRLSTYFVWAALLSNASRIHFYSVDSPATRTGFFAKDFFTEPYNFTFHPELRERMRFMRYQQEI